MNNTTKQLRSAALFAQRRTVDDAQRIVAKYTTNHPKTTTRLDANKLKVSFIGGLNEVGEKNMAVIEYQDEAIVLDCGNNLGIDLPGINYEINDPAYLKSIKHKLKAYVITHGHLDHIGGLRHIVPKYPAPIYGSRYTIGVIARQFSDETASAAAFEPDLNIVDIDSHEPVTIGIFRVEFIRVTHSLPDPAAVCIETPVGRIIATGDFRLDPEPLDNLPTDTVRLEELGRQGVLLLLSDSSYADADGRTPTEHTLQDSFTDIITTATGRIFVAVFSSNINRIQMIINAATIAGRKVALDGRSMLGFAEIAVRQGLLKVPKGTIVPMQLAASLPEDQVLIMCTGGQGEPNAALGRMAIGQHKHIKLDKGDTVIISSTPIPGNEISYDQLGNQLIKSGAKLYRHTTHELDGCGPLHVSGHAKRGELRDMIHMTRPRFFIPVHAGRLRRSYHAQLGRAEGIPSKNILLPDNGDALFFTSNSVESAGKVAHGSLLVDSNGMVVSDMVLKDRLMLSGQGIVTIVLTVDKTTGSLLASPDIIMRGLIAMKDNEQLVRAFRHDLQRIVQQTYKGGDETRLKDALRDFTVQFAYSHTGRSPIVVPIINTIASQSGRKIPAKGATQATR